MQLSMNFEPFCAKLGNILLKIVTYFLIDYGCLSHTYDNIQLKV